MSIEDGVLALPLPAPGCQKNNKCLKKRQHQQIGLFRVINAPDELPAEALLEVVL
jgi:hypothetical protein